MIEPKRSGADLLALMDEPVAPGSVSVWPLGQSGLLVRFPERKVYIDLYLSNHCEAVLGAPFDHRRLSRAPLDPAEISDADVVICSHEHLDHLDVPTLRTLARSSPQATVVAPEACRDLLRDLGWASGRIRGTKGDETFELASLTIQAFPVAHDDYLQDPVLGHHFQGYAVSDGQVTVAHVGDARADDLLTARVAAVAPDLLCLPVNGRDDDRRAMGFAGNMNAEEAFELAKQAGARHVLPMHDDMFAQNIDADARARFMTAATNGNGPAVVRPALGEGALVHA